MSRAAGLLGLALALGLGAAASPAAHADSAAPQEAGYAYDGRFSFVRLRFDEGGGGLQGFGRGRGRGREPMWAHDHPRAETNFLRIMQELTSLQTDPDHHLVLDVDDPELGRNPIAYIVEVGYWNPSESEVQALRAWLLKGGLLIVDDFRGDHWANFEAQMARVLPEARFHPIEKGAEVFDSFFHIADPESLAPPYDQQLIPLYLGIFEKNDPAGRLMVIANYNNDLQEYWEFSDYGYYPIDLANEAYKFGVNYVIYGLTH